MTRTTLKTRKPRINLAALRRDLKDVVRQANDMNFVCHYTRNEFIADSLLARGNNAPKIMLVTHLARLAGMKVVNGVIFS